MLKELKLRIHHHKHIEKNLIDKGAKFTHEASFLDTYFKQPKGRVHKIVEKNSGIFLNIFQAVNGKFEVVKDESIGNVEDIKKELTSKYGIKRILKGTRKFFKYKEFTIIFNLINNVGEFFILVGEEPTKSIIENELQIKNPEYISVSFDELPTQK